MYKNKFWKMSATELAAYHSRSQNELEFLTQEKEFREWCRDNEEDYENEDARERYLIEKKEMSGDDDQEG